MKQVSNLSRASNVVIIAAGVITILVTAKNFLIPLALGIVLWYFIVSLTNAFNKIHKKFPYWLSLLLAIITVGLALYGFTRIIISNVNQIVEVGPVYQQRISEIILNTYNSFNATPSESVRDILNSLDFGSFFGALANSLTNIVSKMGLIILYAIFLVAEYRTFDDKLNKMFKSRSKFKGLVKTIRQITADIGTYAKIKVLGSLGTGLLTYIILAAIGVDFAAFWALLTFILNFIPSIGSILAVVFPVLQTLVQFDTLQPFVLTLILLLTAQLVVGNIIEPKFLGQTLNLSPFVIILSLTLWGLIWGVIGMILAVPIMVILNIILSKFEATEPIYIALSGNVKNKKSFI